MREDSKGRGDALPLSIFILCCICFACPAQASILRWLSPSGSGAGGVFPDNSSENDFDLTRPAFLVNEKQPRVIYSYEYEDTYKLKKGDELKYLLNSSKNKLAFVYPKKFRRYDVAVGFDKYVSKQKVFTNHEDIKATDLNFSGTGYTLGLASSYRNFSLGYFQQSSASDGAGSSLELLNAISLLSPDAKMQVVLGEEKRGFHYGVTYKGTSIYYLKNNFTVPVDLRMSDAVNDFYMPIRSRGDSYEVTLLSKAMGMPVMGFFQEGSSASLDKFFYNNAPDLGTHLMRSRYKYMGFGITRNKVSFSAETYKGTLAGAASIDIIGTFFGLVGGYYLLHYNADLKFNRYKLSYNTVCRKMPLHFGYDIMFFNLNMHYDSAQRFFFGFVEKNKTVRDARLEGYILHNIGIGIKRKINKHLTLGYNLTQQLPPIQRKKADKVTQKVGGLTPEEKGDSKTTGGTLHIFTLEYNF